jgi:hypothetical protein
MRGNVDFPSLSLSCDHDVSVFVCYMLSPSCRLPTPRTRIFTASMVLCPTTSRSLICLSILILCIPGSWAKESAWNGNLAVGSASTNGFTPYYVPPGAKSYDSSSPLIHYTGAWTEVYSPSYVHNSVHRTFERNATIKFTFTGTGIEWFGNTGRTHGQSYVYLDGALLQTVDTWSLDSLKQQRNFWVFDLPDGKHTLKIVNGGKSSGSEKHTRLDLDAFVVTKGSDPHRSLALVRETPKYSRAPSDSQQWNLVQKGSTGVHAMQLAIISPTHAIIVDKVEHNPLSVSGHPAWAALYNLDTHAVKPLDMQSNSFCAGGSFLSNGTMIIVGGNPVVSSHTGPSDFGDLNGLQSVRIFEPCDSETADDCQIYEDHSRIRLASPRWYNAVVRISDGSALIIGGSKKGGWINNATVNNPTIEYFPPKSIHNSNGLPIQLPFLADTLNSNLFPIAFSLPDGKIFMAANQDAMIYDWQTNTERRLPTIPNGVRVTYPMTGTGLLLPLSPENDYAPEILLCGGSTLDDNKPGYEISSQDAASAQCSRILLTDEGIAAGWKVEQMPQARVMPDAVLLPTGQVFIVNGARTGIAGYGNVLNQVGASNADNPVLTPVLYDPEGPYGARFSSSGMPTSGIPRLYHSVATLTPNGDIMIAGSNPNLDRSEVAYGTEYRVEWVSPPYMGGDRPAFGSDAPKSLGFGEIVDFPVDVPPSVGDSVVKGQCLVVGVPSLTHRTHCTSSRTHGPGVRDPWHSC